MSVLLIDGDGSLWDGASVVLRDIYDTPHSDGAFVQYSVINLGFIALDRFGTSLQVRLRPRIASDQTLEALRTWFNDRTIGRVALSWFDTEWHYEIYAAPSAVLTRIDDLTRLHRASVSSFLARPRAFEDFRMQPEIGSILAKWSGLDRGMTQAALASLVRHTLGERYVIVSPDAAKNQLVFKALGSDMYKRYLPWDERPIGKPFENQPDAAYGRWARERYEQALVTRRPQVEDVDAIVSWPGRGKSRLRYTRLLIPYQGESQEPEVLGGTLIDPGIDLRSQA